MSNNEGTKLLNRERLAEAVFVISSKPNNKDSDIKIIPDVLFIRNVNIDHITPTGRNVDTILTITFETYIEDVCMGKYTFTKSIKNLNNKFEPRFIDIIHSMPYQFIDVLNTWSKTLYKNRYDSEAIRRYSNEESKLIKYRVGGTNVKKDN